MKKGISPIFEPGLDELVKKNYIAGRLKFSTNLKDSVLRSDIIFISYYEFLNKENNKYNLTNITDFDDFISLHVLDSLSLILPIQKYNINHQNILDIGSGNGFPGIPFQICNSHSNMILVDSVKKKANFMQKLIKLLNLNEIKIVNDRIEDLGRDKYFRKTQNLILARAVAKISTLLEVSLPLLEIGGY